MQEIMVCTEEILVNSINPDALFIYTCSEIEFITKLLEHKIHFIGLNIDFFEIKL